MTTMTMTPTELNLAYRLNRRFNTMPLRLRTILYALNTAENEEEVLHYLRALAIIANVYADLTSDLRFYWERVSQVMESEGFSSELQDLVISFAANLEGSKD
jgi:hypothetical protein